MKNIIYLISLIIITTGCFSSKKVQKEKQINESSLETEIVNKIDSARESKKDEEKETEKQTEYNSETKTVECFDSVVTISNIPGASKEINDALAKNPIKTNVKGTRTTTKKENLKTNESEHAKINERISLKVKSEEKKKTDSTSQSTMISKDKETKGIPWYLYMIIGIIITISSYFAYKKIKGGLHGKS